MGVGSIVKVERRGKSFVEAARRKNVLLKRCERAGEERKGYE